MPGQFAPGQSGNPGGRAKGLTLKIKQATNDGQDLVDYFVGLFYDEKQPERVRTMAANWLADRGYGKPVQTTELTGADGGPVLTGHIDMTGDDLDNLYVSDASIFPSSGGINPALTIAANALRLAAHLNGRY
jgi:hypothetical protein